MKLYFDEVNFQVLNVDEDNVELVIISGGYDDNKLHYKMIMKKDDFGTFINTLARCVILDIDDELQDLVEIDFVHHDFIDTAYKYQVSTYKSKMDISNNLIEIDTNSGGIQNIYINIREETAENDKHAKHLNVKNNNVFNIVNMYYDYMHHSLKL